MPLHGFAETKANLLIIRAVSQVKVGLWRCSKSMTAIWKPAGLQSLHNRITLGSVADSPF